MISFVGKALGQERRYNGTVRGLDRKDSGSLARLHYRRAKREAAVTDGLIDS
jgi:hypothetical protein